MRSAFTLSDALEYETPNSKVSFLRQLLAYDLPGNYRDEQTALINEVTVDKLNKVARDQLNLDDMQIIVVGDKDSLMTPLGELGLPITVLSLDAQ